MIPSAPSQIAPMYLKFERSVSLDAEDRAAVDALPYMVRRLGPADYIVRDRDLAQHCCLLLSGFAFRSKIVVGGLRQVLSIHMAGDMVDLQNSVLGIADHNVQALTAVQIALIPREAIVEIAAKRPAVGHAMWRDTLVDGSIEREWIANVGRRDARTRMAHLLCEFSLRLEHAGLGEACNYELPMTQEQIGDCLGLTSVHVNRTLKRLEGDGLISRSKRAVRVNEWDRLAAAGDFSSAYLHIDPTRGPLSMEIPRRLTA